MDTKMDEDDLLALSERLLPLTSTSYTTNNSTSRNTTTTINRTRSLKPQKITSHEPQMYYEEISLPVAPNPGDILQMRDGSRKKYNGSSWRRMCSKTNCTYYTQSQGLCKPHLAALKKRKIIKNDNELSINNQLSSESEQPKKGDIIVLPNGIRKKFDGRQYRRICNKSNCTVVVHGSLEYQNGYMIFIFKYKIFSLYLFLVYVHNIIKNNVVKVMILHYLTMNSNSIFYRNRQLH